MLEWLVKMEKKATTTQYSISLLSKSTILPFMNLAILILVANKDFGFTLEGVVFEIIPLFRGEHSGFDH